MTRRRMLGSVLLAVLALVGLVSPAAATLTAAARLPADYQRIYDYPSDPNAQTTPSLVGFIPSVPLRPSL